ncbi:MAG: hypothetical protein GF346_00685 [Candidatus Eisenbacteria bacterium]|nr:hypothetical protein [Candidatus Latescibacterota bacterium]MBD3300947.1 hypothetical protein [Candidatus Eisenbacteria bacterium]
MRKPVSAVAALLLVAALPCTGHAETVRLEAEDVFINGITGNIAGQPFEAHGCQSASGGYGVDGVDYAGEWIAWNVTFDDTVCFTDSLRSARTTDLEFDFEIQYGRSVYEILETDTLHTAPGAGVG